MAKRPDGVTIASILGILLALLMLYSGVSSLASAAFMQMLGSGFFEVSGGFFPSGYASALANANYALGVTALIVGAGLLIGFYHLLGMRKLGFKLVMIFGILTIVWTIGSMVALSLISAPLIDTLVAAPVSSTFLAFALLPNIILIGLWVLIIIYLYTKRKLFKKKRHGVFS